MAKDRTDLTAMYEQKKTTPEKMAEYVRSGDVIASATAIGEPMEIINAICDRALAEDLRDIRLCKNWMVPMGGRYTRPELEGRVTPVSLFAGSSDVRPMIGSGRADYIPCSLFQQLEVFKSLHPRIAVAMASPMDEDGYFTFSTAPLEGRTITEIADIVLLEVSPHMPKVYGDNYIHISDVTALCETDIWPKTVPLTEPDPEDVKIAEYIVDRIPDGACVQFGIGKVPDAVGSLLKNKKDLGIHTELLCSSMYELIKAGAVNNSRKQIDVGKTIFTFCGGTRELYDYIDGNPSVEGHQVAYVNNPYVIAQNDNLMSINAALETDIFGQVCSESLGPVKISGAGGQLDFVRGANMSKGGKSFIAMHSTAKNGTVSKIKPILTPGSHVTVPMNDVNMIVTEYGVAELKYKSASERAKAMISIAHPDFRDEMLFEAKKAGLMI